jgi:hypothetical protein
MSSRSLLISTRRCFPCELLHRLGRASVTRLGELSWLAIKGFEGLADGRDLAIDLITIVDQSGEPCF